MQYLKWTLDAVTEPSTEYTFRAMTTIIFSLALYKSAKPYGFDIISLRQRFPKATGYAALMVGMFVVSTLLTLPFQLDDWYWVGFAIQCMTWATMFLMLHAMLCLQIHASDALSELVHVFGWAYLLGILLYPLMFAILWIAGDFQIFADYRGYPPFGGISHYSYHVTFGLVICAVLLPTAQPRWQQILFSVGLVLFWAFIIWGGRRGPVLLSLTLLPALLFYMNAKRMIIWTYLAFAAGCIVAYIIPNVPSNSKLWGRLNVEDGANLAQVSSGRLSNWPNYLSQAWADNPWLGFGPGQIFPNLGVVHADNFIVTTAIEFGPVIAAILSGLYLFAIWSFGRKIKHAKRPAYKMAFAIFAFSYPFGLLDGPNYIVHGLGVCVFMLGILTIYYDDP